MRKKQENLITVSVELVQDKTGKWVIKSEEDVFPKEVCEYMLNKIYLESLAGATKDSSEIIKSIKRELFGWKLVATITTLIALGTLILEVR